MVKLGLTLSSEEHGPARLVELAVSAEERGFDFISVSDHYHPWISEQGHSPFVWAVLGAIAQATDEIEVGVGVTCPTIRVHPAILAQAVATTGALLEGRLIWGVGTGENLNEHVTGADWPTYEIRAEMLEEAIEVIRRLWAEESVTHRGRYYTVEDARVFDRPHDPVPIVVSAFGESSAQLAARIGDGLWLSSPSQDTIRSFQAANGEGPIFAQIHLCWGTDQEEAVELAHLMWPNTGLPGQLGQDLRTMLHFEQAVELVTPEVVAEQVPCGPDPEPVIKKAQEAIEAGVDHLYFHQIGDDQEGFLDFWEKEIRDQI
ncbi:MAG: TIGR03557 family F420-dependent LLM class oxidoreductase [Acidimicrobiia bacterium]